MTRGAVPRLPLLTLKPALDWVESRLSINVAVHLPPRRNQLGTARIATVISKPISAAAKVMGLDTLPKTDVRPGCCRYPFEGKPSDFEPFLKLGAVLHLNADAYTTFHHLVSADVLYDQSSFSYLAAILEQRGIVSTTRSGIRRFLTGASCRRIEGIMSKRRERRSPDPAHWDDD